MIQLFRVCARLLEEKNAKEAFRMAHTLKGICSNLGFDELYKASYDLTEDLRDGELSGFEQDYEKVCEKYKIVYDNVTKIDS